MTVRNIILHAHIFKNAGSTFDWSLERNFSAGFVDHRDDIKMINGKLNYLRRFLEDNPDTVAVSSHRVHFRVQDVDGFRFFPVYFLRDPIERVRSVYNFEKKQTGVDTKGSRMAKELSFKDFIEWYMRPDSPATIRNSQTIYCAGTGLQETAKSIDLALEFIKHNRMTGIVDMYDETMVLFEEFLRDQFPAIDLSYVIRNVTQDRTDISTDEKRAKILDELGEVGETLMTHNQNDITLYKRGKELLQQRVAGVTDFDAKLRDFRERCRARIARSAHKIAEIKS